MVIKYDDSDGYSIHYLEECVSTLIGERHYSIHYREYDWVYLYLLLKIYKLILYDKSSSFIVEELLAWAFEYTSRNIWLLNRIYFTNALHAFLPNGIKFFMFYFIIFEAAN